MAKIVNTDNFARDYPGESFLNIPITTYEKAGRIAEMLNSIFCAGGQGERFWKVVDNNYELPKENFFEP